MKWISYIAGFLGLVVLGLYLFVKFYVGAVNVPLTDYKFDNSALDQQIVLPEGFSLGIYARDIANARLLAFTRAGDLLVANPNLNQILLLGRDANGDAKADGQKVLLEGLNGPNGMDFYQGWLYVAETDAIGRIAFDHNTGEVSGSYERLVTGLPAGGNHWKKTLRFGPDGLMYVSMGSSCNVCIEEDERRAAMVRYNPDGTGEEIFARGLRNSAGFDWSPIDGFIYATDNGRDLLGDDFPPCELNRVEQGKHYGWPFANGNKIADPDYGEGHEDIVQSSTAPAHGFRPHNAPLGMVFVSGEQLGQEYKGAAIVALHGSWNRSQKDGYKVVSLHWDESGNIEERDFVSGFLKDDTTIGRPAEVAQGPDGAIYIADDYAGVIYRVAYEGGGQNQETILSQLATSRDLPAVYVVEDTLSEIDAQARAGMEAEGRTLYEKHACSACHAQEGEGMIRLSQIGTKYNLDTLATYLSAPIAPMPVFPLNDQQKQALGVYLLENY